MDQDQKFSVVLPAELSKSEDGEWRVFGLASTPKRDLQGEVIDLQGIDLTPIQKGKGVFNWDHKEGPENTIGSIDTYKKADDGLYLGGYLYKNHDRAKSIYQIMSSLKKSDKGKIGMSVEGIIKKRSGADGKTISKAIITKCALTMNPVNTDTYADLVKSLSAGEVEFDADALADDGSITSESFEKGAGEGARGGRVIGHTKAGKPIYASNGGEHAGEMHPHFSAEDHEHARAHLAGRAGEHVHAMRSGVPGAKESYEYFNNQAGHHVVAKYDKQIKKSLGDSGATATTVPADRTGGDALAQEDLQKNCEKCTKSEPECKCSKSLVKGDSELYKSLLCDLMGQLKTLYPGVDQSELWEVVRERLNRTFPNLNVR